MELTLESIARMSDEEKMIKLQEVLDAPQREYWEKAARRKDKSTENRGERFLSLLYNLFGRGKTEQ